MRTKNIIALFALLVGSGNITVFGQTSTENYIKTETVLVSGKTTESLVNTLGHTQKQQSVTYYDALGRLTQTNLYKASGDGSKDIITSIGYDGFGREEKKFLPFASDKNGGYHDDPESVVNWYNYFESGDLSFTYSQTVYETSPLSRVEKQTMPGFKWRNNLGHELKFEQGTNGPGEVEYFYVNSSGILSKKTMDYAAGTLYKITSWDENNSESFSTSRTEEFTDKLGNVILTKNWNGSTEHQTYYVYDDFNRLCFVLPPKAVEDESVTSAELSEFCYQYKYDERGRLTEKKLPGADWVYFAYDSWNRVRATQNGNQRLSNKWEFIKYDELNRPIMTGIYTVNSMPLSSMQGLVNMFELNDTRTTDSYGYSFTSFPNESFSWYYGFTIDVQTVIYYDDYSYQSFWPGSSVFNSYQAVYSDQAMSPNVRGQVTGVRTKVLDTSTWLYAVNYYDKYGRLLQQYQSNPDGGYNRTSTAYNFTNQPIKQQVYHKKTSSSTAITTEEQYTYDHMGRALTTTHSYNGGTTVAIAQNTYDEIGRLQKKELHNGCQDLDYTYNIRGWLTQINDPTAAVTNDKKFAMKLYYDADMTSTLSGGAQFNGNINGLFWQKADGTKKGYNFSYDGLNRLTNADYGTYSTSWSNTSAYDMSITLYDRNGNIRNLTRKNSSGSNRESLAYIYTGNQLASVSGYYGGNSIPTKTFSYDSNGNATTDNLRETTIQYFDELNLPKKYTQGTNYAQYEYDADGTKWSKTVVKGAPPSTTEYYGNFIYQDGVLDKVLTSEGYYQANKYHYFLKDHLGNTRMVVSYSPTGSTPTIEQETEYYPFGSMFADNSLDKNKYLYNGKELQDEFFENYDYGARFYDPALGRWHSVDPSAETYYSWSPYNYTLNNPIIYIDPNGQWVKGAGFWNNVFKSDERIYAEQYATEANQQDDNYTYSVGKENGQIGVFYTANFWTNHGEYSAKYSSFTPVGKKGELGETSGDFNYASNAPASGAVTPSYPIENLLIGGAIAKPITFLGGRLLSGIASKLTSRGITSADGFLFRGFTVKTPIDIPVQRFGNMSLNRPDFWGMRIGTSNFANRTFGAIKPSWNSLTQYTTGVIPKGTPIRFGVIGPQGWRYPGGSLQFIAPSRSVISQSSKFIPR